VHFADTSARFAFLVADDRRHGVAVAADAALRARRELIWTIDPVLTELWLLLRRETSRELSDRLVSGLLEGRLRRESLPTEGYLRAWELARDWPDQDFSLTDRQSFAAVERSRHLWAWSYDADFAVVRLGRQRRAPLERVRYARSFFACRPGIAALGLVCDQQEMGQPGRARYAPPGGCGCASAPAADDHGAIDDALARNAVPAAAH
jgi:predicted nucleic acid-binding protein